jgi:hypothetical protein
MAHGRDGALGYNCSECRRCHDREWFASSCGDRHCPNFLGARQARWSEQVCERLADCPHFHVVFSLPQEVWKFFEDNYRVAAQIFFGAASETLKTFQSNNWGCEGGYFGVLHTWGSALNWHPHLHCLVSGGGVDRESGRWKKTRANYLFPVRAMSKVFGAIFLRKLEELDGQGGIKWPEGAQSIEERRSWRQMLATRSWNIHSRTTLNKTRAVVRYLARYTSRIAMSNSRLVSVDSGKREVTFRWKDYRSGGHVKERTLSGKHFIWLFTRHLVPKGYRRVRYFGWLAGGQTRLAGLNDERPGVIGERAIPPEKPACQCCQAREWIYVSFFVRLSTPATNSRFSLVELRAGP